MRHKVTTTTHTHPTAVTASTKEPTTVTATAGRQTVHRHECILYHIYNNNYYNNAVNYNRNETAIAKRKENEEQVTEST